MVSEQNEQEINETKIASPKFKEQVGIMKST